jgi:hypothetical protein
MFVNKGHYKYFGILTLQVKNQALDQVPHTFSKPLIRIRLKWKQIRNPDADPMGIHKVP